MNSRKNLLIILILIMISSLVVLSGLLLPSKETHDSTEGSEAIANENSVRRKYGVPPIESDWIEHRRNANSIFWANRIRGVSDYKPFHLSKTINISQGTTVSEEDDFHFQVNDSLGYRLILMHEYLGQEGWKDLRSEFVIYTVDRYVNTSSKVVNNVFADSVLREWSVIAKRELVQNPGKGN